MTDSISTSVILKHCGYAIAGIAGAFTMIGIDPKASVILAILMILDTITGIAKTLILHSVKSYKSMKLIAGIVTKLLVWTIPLVFGLVGVGVQMDLHFLISAAFMVLIFGEATSILGNIHSIHKKKETGEFDAVAIVYGVFRNFIEGYLESVKNIKK